MSATKELDNKLNEIQNQYFDQIKNVRKNTTFHNVRYFIIFIGGMISGTMFFTRLNITIAMIKMVNHTYLDPNKTLDENYDPSQEGEFNWPNVVQQFIISGYMIAYAIPQFYMTRLSIKYGMRGSVAICLSICSISCLLTPVLAHYGWGYVMALRLLNGIGASSIFPTIIGMIENWMPCKSTAIGLSLLQFVQTILYTCTPLISGYLAGIHWKWAFYVPGITGLFFSFVWYIIVRENPEECSLVSQKEIDLIKGLDDPSHKSERKPTRTDLPWYFMFKLKNFYILVVVWFIFCGTFGGFLNLLPSYLNKAMKLSVEDIGFYNFIVQVGVLGSMLWANPVIELLQDRFKMTLTNARKVIVFIYTLMSVLTWTYVSLYHDNQIIAICINRFFHMTNDTIITSTLMSQFGKDGLSSTVYSMMNSFGNPASIILCSIVGEFLDQTGESLTCWSWVFNSMSILNVILMIVYLSFLDSEPVVIKQVQNKGQEPQTEKDFNHV